MNCPIVKSWMTHLNKTHTERGPVWSSLYLLSDLLRASLLLALQGFIACSLLSCEFVIKSNCSMWIRFFIITSTVFNY